MKIKKDDLDTLEATLMQDKQIEPPYDDIRSSALSVYERISLKEEQESTIRKCVLLGKVVSLIILFWAFFGSFVVLGNSILSSFFIVGFISTFCFYLFSSLYLSVKNANADNLEIAQANVRSVLVRYLFPIVSISDILLDIAFRCLCFLGVNYVLAKVNFVEMFGLFSAFTFSAVIGILFAIICYKEGKEIYNKIVFSVLYQRKYPNFVKIREVLGKKNA